jgi:hypothetical protein
MLKRLKPLPQQQQEAEAAELPTKDLSEAAAAVAASSS